MGRSSERRDLLPSLRYRLDPQRRLHRPLVRIPGSDPSMSPIICESCWTGTTRGACQEPACDNHEVKR